MRLGFGYLFYRVIRSSRRNKRTRRPKRRQHETTVQKQARLRDTSPARAQAVAFQGEQAARLTAIYQRRPDRDRLRAEALARYNARRKGGIQ